jgi:hypothetical protein
MGNKQRRVESLRVVKVVLPALIQREVAQVLVVGVVLDMRNPLSANALQDRLYDCGLARRGSSGHPNDQFRTHHRKASSRDLPLAGAVTTDPIFGTRCRQDMLRNKPASPTRLACLG